MYSSAMYMQLDCQNKTGLWLASNMKSGFPRLAIINKCMDQISPE